MTHITFLLDTCSIHWGFFLYCWVFFSMLSADLMIVVLWYVFRSGWTNFFHFYSLPFFLIYFCLFLLVDNLNFFFFLLSSKKIKSLWDFDLSHIKFINWFWRKCHLYKTKSFPPPQGNDISFHFFIFFFTFLSKPCFFFT